MTNLFNKFNYGGAFNTGLKVTFRPLASSLARYGQSFSFSTEKNNKDYFNNLYYTSIEFIDGKFTCFLPSINSIRGADECLEKEKTFTYGLKLILNKLCTDKNGSREPM